MSFVLADRSAKGPLIGMKPRPIQTYTGRTPQEFAERPRFGVAS
jgi:hypothetical protein